MSKFRSTAAASTTLLVTSLVPAFGATAVATEASSLDLTPQEVQTCIAPLATSNPDVLQGWIDNCRREKVRRTAAQLGNKV